MTNRSRGKFDITLDDGTLKMGFNLAHDLSRGALPGKPAVVDVEYSPGRLDEELRNADVARVVDNLDAGMGYSRRIADVPNGYAFCLPGYTRAPGGIFCPAGKVTEITLPPGFSSWIIDSCRFRDKVYLICQSNQVLELSADGLTATVCANYGPSFQARGVAVFNNRMYLGGQSGGLAYLDGVTGNWSAPAPVYRSQLQVVNWRPLGVPTDVLVGISSDLGWNSVRWCPITEDPMVDANWSAPVRVGGDGDPRYTVMNLVAAPRHLYMLRPDGIWDMDELGARTFNLTPWVRESADFFNGAFGLHIGDGLYYGHSQGLAFVPTGDEAAQKAPEWAHPGWGLPYEGPVRGMAMAGTLHQGWGMIGQWSATSPESYVSAGRHGKSYGQATHIWHGAEAVIPGGIQHMKVHTLAWASSWPQLLITATGPGTATHAYWQSLPRTGSPLQEMLWGGQFVPAEAGSLFLPSDDWGRPSSVKSLLQVEMITERLNLGSDYLKVYADADGAGAWAEQGIAEDGTYTELAPLDLTEGRFLSTRVDAVGTPILRSIELRAAMGFQLREARVYRVVLGHDDALRTPRGREVRDPEQRMLDLRTMLGRVVTLEDEYPMRVRVLQVMAPQRRQLGGPNRAGAWSLVVPIMVSILDHPYRYDGSERLDTDRTYG